MVTKKKTQDKEKKRGRVKVETLDEPARELDQDEAKKINGGAEMPPFPKPRPKPVVGTFT